MPQVMLGDISTLTFNEICDEARRFIQIPRHITRRKDLINFIDNSANVSVINHLKKEAFNCRDKCLKRKPKVDNDEIQRRVTRRKLDVDDEDEIERYLELPSDKKIVECYRGFLQATGNEAVSLAVCGVCTREVNKKTDKVTTMALEDIPNPHCLFPLTRHPAHDIYNEMLLEPCGVDGDTVAICGECLKELRRDIETPPQLLLTNNLWVGNVPWEL
jgi:hypothetical protein